MDHGAQGAPPRCCTVAPSSPATTPTPTYRCMESWRPISGTPCTRWSPLAARSPGRRGPTRLPGLDPNGRYRVRLRPPGCDTGSGWPTAALVEPDSTCVFGPVWQCAQVRAGAAP